METDKNSGRLGWEPLIDIDTTLKDLLDYWLKKIE